jgi:Zn-dependent M28 family amino/carboxypeptidase
VEDSTVASSYYPSIPAVIAGPPLATRLLEAARRQGTVRVTVAASADVVHARNVGCLLRGTEARAADTAIVLTAHYDHLGVSTPDERGDSIYNGFSDNAAGVAMLLAIAQGIQRSPAGALRHSLLLLFFTGEERGLLGSDYFVARPPYPLGRLRAVINLDAGAPPARPWNWRVAGGDGIPLGSLAMDVAAARGWAAVTSAATPNSDYFPFARAGVPAVFLIPGTGPYEGLTSDSSDALRRRWDEYHQAADAWYPDFPFEGLQRYAEFALALASAVDRYTGDLLAR